MTELKTPEKEAKSFTANGVEYFIEQSLSFERYKMYQKLQIECGYDVTFYGMFEKVKEAYGLLNKMKMADAAVILHNIMSGVSNVDKRQIPVLEMCALFINAKDENRNEINQDMVDKKIADWQQEGIAVDYFFSIAISTMQNFVTAYNEVSQLSSLRTERKKEKPVQEATNTDIPTP